MIYLYFAMFEFL